MARVIYDQSVFVILHCEECGLMGNGYNASYFESDGHLVDFQEIRTMVEARRAQRVHQKWHDSESRD
jgi:hypothetical protein